MFLVFFSLVRQDLETDYDRLLANSYRLTLHNHHVSSRYTNISVIAAINITWAGYLARDVHEECLQNFNSKIWTKEFV